MARHSSFVANCLRLLLYYLLQIVDTVSDFYGTRRPRGGRLGKKPPGETRPINNRFWLVVVVLSYNGRSFIAGELNFVQWRFVERGMCTLSYNKRPLCLSLMKRNDKTILAGSQARLEKKLETTLACEKPYFKRNFTVAQTSQQQEAVATGESHVNPGKARQFASQSFVSTVI